MLGNAVPQLTPNETMPTTVDSSVLGFWSWIGPPESPWHASLFASGSYAHNWPSTKPLRRLGWLALRLYSINVELHDGSITDVTFVFSSIPDRTLPTQTKWNIGCEKCHQQSDLHITYFPLVHFPIQWSWAEQMVIHRSIRFVNKPDEHRRWIEPQSLNESARCRWS